MEHKEFQKLFKQEKRHDDIELCLVTLQMLEEQAKAAKTPTALEEWARALTEGTLLAIRHRDKEFLTLIQKKTKEMTHLGFAIRGYGVVVAVLKGESRRSLTHSHRR
jgi:hypothetical protein